VGGLQLVGAAWTAGGPALDTAQALKSESNLGATAASIAHVNLLWLDMGLLQEMFCYWQLADLSAGAPMGLRAERRI
jgi:hypothetical protein